MATPIGNLRDVTERARVVLGECAVIAAEDTRVTRRLLDHWGITARLLTVHAHNEARAAADVLDVLAAGGDVALVSDAGTPAISDPGARVVAAVRARGYAVSPLPGANAAVAAVSVSGFDAPHFLFYGFLPARAAARRVVLETLAAHPFTLVFHEAPHRVTDCVADLAAVLGGERRILIARELTKLFEQTHLCTLAGAGAWLAADDNRRRGEFVLVVEGARQQESSAVNEDNTLRVLAAELPLKQAVALAVKLTGGNRNALYERALLFKQGGN